MSWTDELVREARAVADAVLYEGYLLYPYRASAAKNRIRWQFGVLGPDGAAGAGEDSTMATDCLLRAEDAAEVALRVRFLQLQSRSVERYLGGDRFTPVAELEGREGPWLSWDEAIDREVDLGRFAIGDLEGSPRTPEIRLPGGRDVEHLYDDQQRLLGRVVRRRWPLTATLRLSRVRREGQLYTLRLDLANGHHWHAEEEPTEADHLHTDQRARALRYSLLSAHIVLQADGGVFVSVIDPPAWAAAAARERRDHRLWPVLIGREGGHGVVLAAPIILYDWPQIAEQSAGDMFDSTEIDELLSLRVMALTDEEKREARATDRRAAEIVDRCETMPESVLEGLHGSAVQSTARTGPGSDGASAGGGVPLWATPAQAPNGAESDGDKPWWDPGVDASVDPATDAVDVAGVPVARGSTVRLHPGTQADAQDLFFSGQVATVKGVHHDVDGGTHLAVVLRDDPASDLHEWYGRYLYFRPEEVEPLDSRSREAEA